jgi:hypothetical protein
MTTLRKLAEAARITRTDYHADYDRFIAAANPARILALIEAGDWLATIAEVLATGTPSEGKTTAALAAWRDAQVLP